jgi:hypothetical protein
MQHTHKFDKIDSGTRMTDIFEFISPLGFLGRLADIMFLKRYMTTFPASKNQGLESVAEGDKWKDLLIQK